MHLDGLPSAANDGGSAAQELLAMALEARVNRIARDLARETGKSVRHWLEQAARMLCPEDDSHLIVEVDGEPMFAVRRPFKR
jgi:hypothetical protein